MTDRDEKTGHFIKGKKGGPGRPKGSRNALGEAFLSDLQADWEKNGKGVIKTVREDRPDVYLKVVASILPKDLNINVNNMDDVTDDELIERIRAIDEAIRPFIDAQGAGEAGAGDSEQTKH